MLEKLVRKITAPHGIFGVTELQEVFEPLAIPLDEANPTAAIVSAQVLREAEPIYEFLKVLWLATIDEAQA